MTYDEAAQYIGSLEKFGSVLGLECISELMKRLGNPQDDVKTIHVAGTNGKGSVITYIEYILRSAGYRTGKYISPSVISYWEKIQIDGEYIEESDVAYIASKVRKACESMVSDGYLHPTVFEFETAMAFLYFKELSCDFAIIETGMGGETDATNVIAHPLCEVITSVSLDHIGVIGNNLEQIAACKAGIIMKDTDVVLYGGSKTVEKTVRKIAERNSARLRVSDFSQLEYLMDNEDGQHFNYRNYKNAVVSLKGIHQLKNAAVALDVTDVLKMSEINIPDHAVYDGLKRAKWPGRFEVICNEPVIVIDGAHNEDAAVNLRESVMKYYSDKKKIFLMGIFKDKDYKKIIELTNGLASEIITINSDNPRSLNSDELKAVIDELKTDRDLNVISCGNPTAGIIKAVKDSYVFGTENTVIVAFGSLSFLGEIRGCVKRMTHMEV